MKYEHVKQNGKRKVLGGMTEKEMMLKLALQEIARQEAAKKKEASHEEK